MNDQDQTAPTEPVRIAGVGATLRAGREKTGKGLAEVAALLRIRQPYLLALEEGRHRDLPGGTYAVGFLRTYAEFLGLDGEEMVRRFRAEAAGDLNTRLELVFPSPVSEGRIPGGAILFLGLLLALVSYGAWYWLSSRDTQVAEMVPALPERLTTMLNRKAELTGEAAKPAETAALAKPEATDAAKPAETPAKPDAPGKEAEMVPPSEDDDSKAPAKPTEAAKPAEATKAAKPAEATKAAEMAKPTEKPTERPAEKAVEKPAEAPAPGAAPVHAAQDTGSRITLTALADDCWMQVREMDGQLLMSRLLRKGDSYAVPNRPGLTLMVGNAGALDVTVDGQKAPSLGAMGLVRRDIRLEPDKLLKGG